MYSTISGDTFDLIAFKVFGDCKFVSDILLANRDLLHTLIFSAGVQINIPAVERKTKSKLPPWKK